MKKLEGKKILFVCKVILVIAIAFWTYIFIDYAITIINGVTINIYVAIILLIEPFIHFITYLAIIKKLKIIFFIGTILIGFNAFLSMSGQMGIIDIIAVGLSVVLLFFLSVSSKVLFTK
ncbi:MAG: hypothetical protein KAG94_04495 [Clostridiales bacterium]|nr:hypothetical protein [Clostridiales bacterium]